jgi:hypothetical protein
MPQIEPVEGFAFQLATLLEAETLARDAPARMSDLHLRHLAAYDMKGAEKAWAERASARSVQAERENTSAAPTRAQGKIDIEAEFATVKAAFRKSVDGDGDDFATYLARHGGNPRRLSLVCMEFASWIIAINTNNKARNVRLDELEQRLAALEIDAAKIDASAVAAAVKRRQIDRG